MAKNIPITLLAIAVLTASASAQQAQQTGVAQSECAGSFSLTPEKVAFPVAGGKTLYGWLYKPAGKGPFQAVVWHHGSGLMDDPALPFYRKDLATFYVANGFVFFTPHRTGHGLSRAAGESTVETDRKHCNQTDLEVMGKCRVRYMEEANVDTVASIEWLKKQPFVIKDRIAVSGASFGGIQTILAAEKDLGVRAFVPFTPAAMTWRNVEIRKRLQTALEKTEAPVFLIQAEGDYSLGPYEVLGGYLKRKGGLNRAKLYPKFGTTEQEAHGVFSVGCEGIKIWGKDVLEFLKLTMK